jgi:hypothetical protein
MTFYDVYVAELEDGKLPTDLPMRESPFFEGEPMYEDPFPVLRKHIESGKFRGGQLDQCAWAAQVSKAELNAFLVEVYGEDVPEEVAEYVRYLPRTREYALVACEL